MAVILGPVSKNQPVAYPGAAGDVVANRFTMTIPAASSTTDIYEIGSIPPNCVVLDATLDIQASLGAAGAVANVGIMSGAPGGQFNADGTTPRTCGTEFFTAAPASAAAPGTTTRMTASTGFRVNPTPAERSIGIQFTTRASGTAGVVALVVYLATT
jgi:hypothetical protein